MKKGFLLPLTILLLSIASCSEIENVVPQNDNAVFYGSEWSTEDETEGLKFFEDNSVLFFHPSGRGAGTFKYDKQSGSITLYNLSTTISGKTAEFTSAIMQSDGTMKLYWHVLGASDNYYMVLYKRR